MGEIAAHSEGSRPGRRRNRSQHVAAQIAALISEEGLPVGTHLPTQELAERFKVSRFPVLQALKALADRGIVRYERDRGFFVHGAAGHDAVLLHAEDPELVRAYFDLAGDVVDGKVSGHVSEAFLRQRYSLGRAQLNDLLNRVYQEGWVERRSGYGWDFTDVLATPEALRHTYDLRLIIEPAGLLMPDYHLSPETIERCRRVEQELLAGGIESAPPDVLYARAVTFHETLASGSGNPFLLDALRRVNRVRRLLMYRSMGDRMRYYRQSKEHLHLLDLVEAEKNEEAAEFMKFHLGTVMGNLKEIGVL